MIKYVILFVFVACCGADSINLDKCRLVKNTMLTCLDAVAGDLPKAVNPEIEWLIFTRSKIPTLKKEHLSNFPKLKDLHLKEASLNKIEDDALTASKSLSWVDVSYNKLTTISPDLFQGLKDMYYFNASYNPNLVIPKNAPFLNTPHLKWLILQNSGIKELYSESFSKLPGLKFLVLSENELTTIPNDLFKPLKHLTSLDLSRNHFKSITVEQPSFRTMALYLGDNPWECDCNLFPTIEWAKTNRIKDDVRCSNLEQKKWQEISNMNCPNVKAH